MPHLDESTNATSTGASPGSLVEALDEAVVAADLDGRITFWNASAERLFGWSAEEALSRPAVEVFLPDGPRPEAPLIVARLREGGRWQGSLPVRRKDGGEVVVEAALSPVRNGDGGVDGYVGVIFDATRSLREAESRDRRDALLEAVAFGAGRFLNADHWEDAIVDYLARLGQAAGVDRVYVYEDAAEGEEDEVYALHRFEWVAEGVVPQIDNPALKRYPMRAGGMGRWIEAFRNGEVVYRRIDDAPASELPTMISLGIRSSVALPIRRGDAWWGHIGFSLHESVRDWSRPEVGAMRLAADLVGVAIDRAPSREDEEAGERWHGSLVDLSPEPIVVHAGGRFLYANAAAAVLLTGVESEDLVGRAFLETVHPSERERVAENLRRSYETDERFRQTAERLVLADGRIRYVDVTSAPVTYMGQRARQMVMRDVTERKRAEDALRRSSEGLRYLAQRLESVREEERGRISRELHDELGQVLTALKLDLSWVQTKVEPENRALQETLTSMLSRVDSTIDNVRRIIAELRPAVLDDLDLFAAVAWLTEQFEERTGIRCQVALEDGGHRVEGERATALFRVLQEALTNIARHARATRASVVLRADGGAIRLEVRDNGRGFQPEALAEWEGLGLLGMRERVRSLGGTIEIDSGEGRGTVVRAEVDR